MFVGTFVDGQMVQVINKTFLGIKLIDMKISQTNAFDIAGMSSCR